MSDEALKATLEKITDQMRSGKDLAGLVQELLNVVEELHGELQRSRERIEFLEGELKKRRRGKSSDSGSDNSDSGESGKGGGNGARKNHSSEKRRKGKGQDKPNKHHGRTSKAELTVHETRRCGLDKSELPGDAQYKGIDRMVVRDLIIQEWNIEFEREVYYSPSEGKRYMAELPKGCQGEFGPTLKTAVVALKYDGGMSESGIVRFLQGHGIKISSGSVSNLLLDAGEFFHGERKEILRQGYLSSGYAQSDDTSAKVMGAHWNTHIVCNENFTAYFTRTGKDRMTVVDVLLGREANGRLYRYTPLSEELLEIFEVSQKQRDRLAELVETGHDYDEQALNTLLAGQFGEKAGSAQAATRIREAMALGYFYEQDTMAFPLTLITDGAPQYELLSFHHAACWIHDGRHYEKLDPLTEDFRIKLEGFRKRYWKYYHELSDWRETPEGERDPCDASRLEKKFDRLFGTRTGYRELDERIAKTLAKKEKLLVVLEDPRVPLHNNASELGARRAARRRDISLHSRSEKGVDAMDTLTTIVETCRKVGVRVAGYIYDRFCGLSSEEGLPARIAEASTC